ncbi:MAG TPA: FAD:protein FMN transferase [Candidatus Pristimantibacillus sp.]|jgi:thiamine biosynthesis lipoprotein|nr:FAD:protein FMN transferase [Candidatus Pristimantibacillus sp.]
MKDTRPLMGMPITVEIVSPDVSPADLDAVYDYFEYVDKTFSTYKKDSEISRVNRGLPKTEWSKDMQRVLTLCAQTKQQTDGYFDIEHDGQLDPSGLVKGWAIKNAGDLLKGRGFNNFYIDAGGDIQISGLNAGGKPWRIGIRNPFNRSEIIKVVSVGTEGVATSGTYIRGQHVYDPHQPDKDIEDVVSLTVIGPDVYNADRFATAAFAMGKRGVHFIEKLNGYEAYMVDNTGMATLTTGFERYVV